MKGKMMNTGGNSTRREWVRDNVAGIALGALSLVAIVTAVILLYATQEGKTCVDVWCTPNPVVTEEPVEIPGPVIQSEDDPQPAIVLPPCEYEDSPNCYWDAGNFGNGEGDSFVDIDGTVHYVDVSQPFVTIDGQHYEFESLEHHDAQKEK